MTTSTSPRRARRAMRFAVAVLLAPLFLASQISSAPAHAHETVQLAPDQDDAAGQDVELGAGGLAGGVMDSGALDAAAPLAVDALHMEAVRDQLDGWVEDLELLYPHIEPHAGTGVDEKFAEAQTVIDGLTYADLAMIEERFSKHPGWWEMPQYLRSLYDSDIETPPFFLSVAGTRQGRGEPILSPALIAVPTPDLTPTAPFPPVTPFPPRGDAGPAPADRPNCPGAFGEATCSECPPSIPTGTIRDIFIVKALQTNVTNFDSGIDTDINICVFPGIGSSIPNPAKYFSLAAKYALDAVVLGLEAAYNRNCMCETAYHRQIQNAYLDATISSRVAQMDLDAHAKQNLVSAIQFNLIDPDADRISLFQLPRDVCGRASPAGFKQCGLLELVREVVADAIERNASASGTIDVNGASVELAAGDMHYSDGEWKLAYERYRDAYRAAVRPEPAR